MIDKIEDNFMMVPDGLTSEHPSNKYGDLIKYMPIEKEDINNKIKNEIDQYE